MKCLELSPIDYVYSTAVFDAISFLLRFDARLDTARVIEAFRETSQLYLGVCARLVQVDPSTLVFDLSNDSSVVTVCDADDDAPWTSQVDCVRSVLGEPLAKVRITRYRESTVVALSLSHVVADGYGYFLFLTAWAARARGEPMVEVHCQRAALRPVIPEVSEAGRRSGGLPESGFFVADDPTLPPGLPWRLSEFSPATNQPPGKMSLSSNDLLSASLWKRSMGDAAPELKTTFGCVVDIRRFHKNLGPLYFGNAILMAPIEIEVSSLTRTSDEEVAEWIRDAVAKVPTRIDAALAELEHIRQSEGVGAFARFRAIRELGLVVTNLSRAPFSAVDFGAGPPAEVQPLLHPSRGKCALVLPGKGKIRLMVAGM